ncbi:MAG: hypothetical protein JZU62_02675 [Sulfuricurvum sp.]|uniref:hypothetical protein n=1 Tax=Sulfuricurvum sp. TaxID=2025608 RepID=UPI0025FA4394|nr:hypothetical protein [Sulfuricurvum sp.]MBV5320564.1 hypothetical protein [Sulfuricurvum sp.]
MLYGNELVDALKQSSVSGYGKTMFVYDDRILPKRDQSTFGIGGKLAVESGAWDGFKAKAAYYITSDLGLRHANLKKTDAYMFDVDKTPYSVLGEASIEYKEGSSTLLFGRQEIDSPIISTYDYRIIPNLFEAYTFTNKALPHTAITLSFISKMSGLDGLVSFKHFRSMSQQTYTSLAMSSDLQMIDSNDGDTIDISRISGDQGVIMSGIVYENSIKIQGWNYYCRDVLDEFYLDMAFPYELSPTLISRFEVQGYGVRDIGQFKDFLHHLGRNGSYELFGTKVSLESKEVGLTIALAYNYFTGDKNTVTAFGNWGGYPEYVAIPYMFAQDTSVSALAKSQMGKLSFKYNLAKAGLPNQTLIGGYSIIDLDERIMPNSDIDIINFVYKAKISDPLGVKIQYEWRDSPNYRYADDMLTLSATYAF